MVSGDAPATITPQKDLNNPQTGKDGDRRCICPLLGSSCSVSLPNAATGPRGCRARPEESPGWLADFKLIQEESKSDLISDVHLSGSATRLPNKSGTSPPHLESEPPLSLGFVKQTV